MADRDGCSHGYSWGLSARCWESPKGGDTDGTESRPRWHVRCERRWRIAKCAMACACRREHERASV